jgi:hypothetical protein
MTKTMYNTNVSGADSVDITDSQATHLQTIVDSINLSTETDILTFIIANQVSSTVNTTNHTVTVNMPYGTVVTSLTPTITVSAGATINPLSGIAQNFISPVNYTVTAEDGTTQQVWVITVSLSNLPSAILYLIMELHC